MNNCPNCRPNQPKPYSVYISSQPRADNSPAIWYAHVIGQNMYATGPSRQAAMNSLAAKLDAISMQIRSDAAEY